MRTPQQDLKRADLVSSLGAGILGGGVALLLAATLRSFTWPILAAGLLLHGWGMYDKHRLERRAGEPAVWWAEAFYWLCWVTLIALAAWILATRRG